MGRITFIILWTGLSVTRCQSQDHYWWAENVGWDGVTHWSEYIQYGTAFMGPNALPVPELKDALLPKQHSIGFTTARHLMPGDQTTNLKLTATWIPASKISIDISYIPVEWYQTSHEVKTERKVFHTFYDSKKASGDLIITSNYQVLDRKNTTIALRWGFRFPTSSMQGAARYTNTPGYYAALSFSQVLQEATNSPLKIHWMGGFYAWQTNQDEQFQNDAFLAGLGLSKHFRKLQLASSIRGYSGYLDIGDSPLIVDTVTTYQLKSKEVSFCIIHGLHDYPFTSIEAGVRLFFRASNFTSEL